MLVEVVHDHVPYVGNKGDRKVLPNAQGKVLVLLGRVREVTDVPAPRRRVYRRRDLQAETPAEEIAVEPPAE